MPILRPDYRLDNLPEVDRSVYKLGGAAGHTVEVVGDLASDNFVNTQSGWIIKGDGSVQFNDGEFRGDISGASGSFGGPLDVGGDDAESWHVDVDGNMWWGDAGSYANATARIGNSGKIVIRDAVEGLEWYSFANSGESGWGTTTDDLGQWIHGLWSIVKISAAPSFQYAHRIRSPYKASLGSDWANLDITSHRDDGITYPSIHATVTNNSANIGELKLDDNFFVDVDSNVTITGGSSATMTFPGSCYLAANNVNISPGGTFKTGGAHQSTAYHYSASAMGGFSSNYTTMRSSGSGMLWELYINGLRTFYLEYPYSGASPGAYGAMVSVASAFDLTTNAANVRIDTSGRIRRVSSSLELKDQVVLLRDHPEGAFDLENFKHLMPIAFVGKGSGSTHFGFAHEWSHGVLQGPAEDHAFDLNAYLSLAVAKIQELEQRLSKLEQV